LFPQNTNNKSSRSSIYIYVQPLSTAVFFSSFFCKLKLPLNSDLR